MSSPFSRTIRSINADSFRTSVAGLVIGFLILAAWSAWFFMAKVSIYKVSPKAYVTGEETFASEFFRNARRPKEVKQADIAAQFSLEDMSGIRTGQTAVLYLKEAGAVRSVPAKVTRIVRKGQPHVELSAQLDANSKIRLRKGDTGEIHIAVKLMSPAALMMQASGLFENIQNGEDEL